VPKIDFMKTASKERYLCSELVKVEWQDKTGAFDATGILEEIWVDGACVQTIGPMQPGIKVWIVARRALFRGTMTECESHRDGYFSRVAFDAESRWSPRSFKPEHMVNTRTVLARWLKQNLAGAEVPKVRAAGQGE
jgi:hypothetical protein